VHPAEASLDLTRFLHVAATHKPDSMLHDPADLRILGTVAAA